MAFRLETFQFDCCANMPTRYGRDLTCSACSPRHQPGQEKEQEQESVKEQESKKEQESEKELESEKEQEIEKEQESKKEQESENEQEQIESQEHLESCPGFSEIWQGLGPYSLVSRCRFFQRVKIKRLKQKQQTAENKE